MQIKLWTFIIHIRISLVLNMDIHKSNYRYLLIWVKYRVESIHRMTALLDMLKSTIFLSLQNFFTHLIHAAYQRNPIVYLQIIYIYVSISKRTYTFLSLIYKLLPINHLKAKKKKKNRRQNLHLQNLKKKEKDSFSLPA